MFTITLTNLGICKKKQKNNLEFEKIKQTSINTVHNLITISIVSEIKIDPRPSPHPPIKDKGKTRLIKSKVNGFEVVAIFRFENNFSCTV